MSDPRQPAFPQRGVDASSQPTPPRRQPPRADPSAFAPETATAPEAAPESPTAKRRGSTASRGRRLPLLVGAGLLIVVLALLAALLLPLLLAHSDPKLQVTSGPTKAEIKKPDVLVDSYLHALAAGRAAEALRYGPTGSGDQALLTDPVLAESRKTMPITDIQVSPADETAKDVAVTYKIGQQVINTLIPVQRQVDGSWQLERATVTVALTAHRTEGVPLLINGVSVLGTSLEVFPGFYAFDTGLPFLRYGAGSELRIPTLDAQPAINTLAMEITPAGVDALRSAARASLDACLKRKELAPANCPFNQKSGQPVDPNSIQRTLLNDPFASYQPHLLPAKPTAEAVVDVRSELTVVFASGSQSKEQFTTTATLAADLAVTTADQLKVSWATD